MSTDALRQRAKGHPTSILNFMNHFFVTRHSAVPRHKVWVTTLSTRTGQQPELVKKRAGRRTARRSEPNVHRFKIEARDRRGQSEENNRGDGDEQRPARRQELALGQLGDETIVRGLAGIRVNQPVQLRGTGQRHQRQQQAEHQPGAGHAEGRDAANVRVPELHVGEIKLSPARNASLFSMEDQPPRAALVLR